MADETPNLLGILGQGLAEFRLQIDGAAGQQVAALGTATGALPDFIRNVLRLIAEALEALHGHVLTAEHFVVQADAVFGLLETTLDLVEASTDADLFAGMAEAMQLPPGPFVDVTEGLQQVNGAVATVGGHVNDVSRLLPRPEDMRVVAGEIAALLGTRVVPEAEGPGPLVSLLSDIGVALTPQDGA